MRTASHSRRPIAPRSWSVSQGPRYRRKPLVRVIRAVPGPRGAAQVASPYGREWSHIMSRRSRPVMLLCLSSVVVVMLAAVSANAQRSEGEKATAPSPAAKGEVLADVDGVPITKEEI